MIAERLALLGVLLAGAYMVVLGVGALAQPDKTRRFLDGFASTARIHFTEMSLRLLAGIALVVRAPNMQFEAVFRVFGWVLVGTTLVLLFVPWRLHRRFASWSVPLATKHMIPFGLSSVAFGAFLVWALIR